MNQHLFCCSVTILINVNASLRLFQVHSRSVVNADEPLDWFLGGDILYGININSPWSTTLLQTTSVKDTYPVTLSSAFKNDEGKTLTVSNNNTGSSFYLTVSGE